MREKLIELQSVLRRSLYAEYDEAQRATVIDLLKTAENLIANGVVISNSETTTKWIPVTERLPERDGHYLCIYHFGEYPRMTFTQVLDYYATDIVPHFQHTLGSMKIDYWMPLPEPPKGE